ncbi:PRC-barrel domain-containing protein [Pelagicoccus sp. SDUM812003]|uniref:PRC-barrel domain-containing protein n=1 Tax=Pelagicoccus sp. SDUM812003 TaxID=3041267 RepID=UPI00281057EE|nr:PRC-barrel domain-containing protein [Pelagicoccus sp. SDUM812003]MDQ8201768.1 PRC-barrel domain-containing protein [Pelagicoccus sp. SDUM812003]
MLRSVKDLIGYTLIATDGKVGKVKDILFGDRSWAIRQLVIDVHRGFNINMRYLSEPTQEDEAGDCVLMRPEQFEAPGIGADRRSLPTGLTQEEVRNCPKAFERPSVEEEYETEFQHYFRHGIYDERPKVIPQTDQVVGYRPPPSAYEHSVEELREHVRHIKDIATHHLHSASKVMNYSIRNQNGAIGVVDDIIVDLQDWEIVHLVLHNGNQLLPKRYLIPIDKIKRIDWSKAAFLTDMGRKELSQLRRYVPNARSVSTATD